MHSIPTRHDPNQPRTFIHFQDMITRLQDTPSQRLDHRLISNIASNEPHLFTSMSPSILRRWEVTSPVYLQHVAEDRGPATLISNPQSWEDKQDLTMYLPSLSREQTRCQKPSASTATLSTASLSSSITTISTSSADDGADLAKDQSVYPAVASALVLGAATHGDENGSKISLGSDIYDNSASKRVRSRSSSYPSVGISSPPPGHSSSPSPTAYAMSITSDKAEYASIPFEVDLHFLSIHGHDEDDVHSEAGPTLQDELAAMAFASNGSTVQTISERVVSSSLGSVKEAQPESEIPTVTITSYDADSVHASSPRRTRIKSSSESSELPPEAYIICMLDAGQFADYPSQKEFKKHLEVPSGNTSRPDTARTVHDSLHSDNTLPEAFGQDQTPSSSPKSKSSASGHASLHGLKSELSLLNSLEEMPPLVKCPRVSSESDQQGTIQSHTTIKSWIKYAICRTKSCLMTQMGRQPSAKATKKIILFKAFRDMKRARVASVRKPRETFVSRSLRPYGKSKRPRIFRGNSISTADVRELTGSQRAVSCPS